MHSALCLWQGEPEHAPIVAVQEVFTGKMYHHFAAFHAPGVVLACSVNNQRTQSVREDGTSPANFKIIQRVHPNTVQAVLRRAGRRGHKLMSGNWYQVHSD